MDCKLLNIIFILTTETITNDSDLENVLLFCSPAVVDLYTCDIQFNTVRLIAVFIICLGFLMLLLPEDWDQCLIQLSTKLRKRDEPAEGAAEAGTSSGLNWNRRNRTSMSTFTH